MTPRERITRLEGLLDRVQRNTARPLARRTVVSSAAPVAAPVVAAPPVAPTPAAPPVVAAPPPIPAPVAEAPPSVPPWKAEPTSTVQARPSSIPPEELSEDDLVEVTTLPPGPPDAGIEAASSTVLADDDEEPPASSRRSKVAESLNQAIANAAAQADEHEVPIQTPPPESGPQEAVLPAGLEAPRAPEFGEMARPPSLGPTPEQLGETIELDEADGPSIEIEVGGLQPPAREPERPVEELEVTLPRAEMPSGMYDVAASMPAVAAPLVPSAAPTVPAEARPMPDVTARPAIEDADVAKVVRITDKAPENFAELLETSLRL